MKYHNAAAEKTIPLQTRISPKQAPEMLLRSNTTTEEEKALKIENTSLYYVVWVNKAPEAVATDPNTAEEIAGELRRSRSGCLVWITKEAKAPEGLPIEKKITAAGIYADFVQDEQLRSACRSCANCGNCRTEYGETFCRLDAMPEDAEALKFTCPDWI